MREDKKIQVIKIARRVLEEKGKLRGIEKIPRKSSAWWHLYFMVRPSIKNMHEADRKTYFAEAMTVLISEQIEKNKVENKEAEPQLKDYTQDTLFHEVKLKKTRSGKIKVEMEKAMQEDPEKKNTLPTQELLFGKPK